jgi:hypothetical protein
LMENPRAEGMTSAFSLNKVFNFILEEWNAMYDYAKLVHTWMCGWLIVQSNFTFITS